MAVGRSLFEKLLDMICLQMWELAVGSRELVVMRRLILGFFNPEIQQRNLIKTEPISGNG
jgi:hypothetical protein